MPHRPTIFTAVLLLSPLLVEGAGKPDSKDLGKIQPPGGVPIDFGKPGTPIKSEGVNNASKRLESSPLEDLDRWVAELERITGQKVEGDLARQACRTYFVARMSVAFDDLRWNPKASAKLFQRARSLPASEAKAWQAAFEALLGKTIGQTATTNHAGGPAYGVPLAWIAHRGETR